MKIKNILFFLPLLLCGALFAANEPVVQGLYFDDEVVLDAGSGKIFYPFKFYINDEAITTSSAEEFFKVSETGVTALKEGLYRVTFFLEAAYEKNSQCSMTIDSWGSVKHNFHRWSKFSSWGAEREDCIQVSQVIKLVENEELRIWFAGHHRKVVFNSNTIGTGSSRFTIEAL